MNTIIVYFGEKSVKVFLLGDIYFLTYKTSVRMEYRKLHNCLIVKDRLSEEYLIIGFFALSVPRDQGNLCLSAMLVWLLQPALLSVEVRLSVLSLRNLACEISRD